MVVYPHFVIKGISQRPEQIPLWVEGYREELGLSIKKLKL
jgi:hypothetical protein